MTVFKHEVCISYVGRQSSGGVIKKSLVLWSCDGALSLVALYLYSLGPCSIIFNHVKKISAATWGDTSHFTEDYTGEKGTTNKEAVKDVLVKGTRMTSLLLERAAQLHWENSRVPSFPWTVVGEDTGNTKEASYRTWIIIGKASLCTAGRGKHTLHTYMYTNSHKIYSLYKYIWLYVYMYVYDV